MNNSNLPIYVLFGKRVRELRKARQLTQQELAELTGLSRSYIGEIEIGKRNVSLKNIEIIAKALQTDVPSLLK